MNRTVVTPAGWSVTVPLSQAVRRGNTVYCSGQVGIEQISGKLAGPGIREQTEQTLRNLTNVLDAAGSSMRQVDKCTVFLTRAEDFATMNEVYKRFFPSEPPARSTVIVAALARADLVVEVECVASV
jgi:reactive intermediate/imine deaminase